MAGHGALCLERDFYSELEALNTKSYEFAVPGPQWATYHGVPCSKQPIVIKGQANK